MDRTSKEVTGRDRIARLLLVVSQERAPLEGPIEAFWYLFSCRSRGSNLWEKHTRGGMGRPLAMIQKYPDIGLQYKVHPFLCGEWPLEEGVVRY